MAVKTSCPRCRKRFSAPDDLLGKKVECPRCGERSVLRTPEEARALAAREKELAEKQEEDRKRIDLIERQERRRQLRENAQPYYERYQTGVQPVRHYYPRAPSRFFRLRSLSDLMVLAAYVLAILSLLGCGLTLYLKVAGVLESTAVALICAVAWLAGGGTLFCLFKYLGELAFLLAELGDHHHDMVQLLLDLRDNTDPRPPGER